MLLRIVQVMRWINDLNFSMSMWMYRYNLDYCIWWIMCNRCPAIGRVYGSPNASVHCPRWWDRVAVCDYLDQCLFVSTMMMGLMLRRRYVCYLLQIGWCWYCPQMLMMMMNHLRNDDTRCCWIDDSQDRRCRCYCWNWCGAQSSFFGTMCLAMTTNMYYSVLSDMMRSAYYFQMLVH